MFILKKKNKKKKKESVFKLFLVPIFTHPIKKFQRERERERGGIIEIKMRGKYYYNKQ